MYGGEQSPYWNWVRGHKFNAGKQSAGEHDLWEPPEANPDMLTEPSDEESYFPEILKQALKEIKFSKVEQAVLLLISQGYTQDKVAELLKVSRTRVRQAISRIEKKGAKWYGTNMANRGDIDAREENL